MAREFLTYDEFTGVTTYTDYDEASGKMAVHSEQNVQPLLDYCAALRNEGIHSPKDELWHWAKIPNVVALDLRRKGIDIFSNDQDVLRRVRREINRNYPYLKTSYAKHE